MRFVLEDFDKVQEEAYEKAIADARSRAERLARLSKVELGPIVAVREIVVPGDTKREATRNQRAQAAGDGEVPGDPGARRASGSLRGPSQQIRRQGEEPMTHALARVSDRSAIARARGGRSWTGVAWRPSPGSGRLAGWRPCGSGCG